MLFSQPLLDCHILGQSVTEDVLVNLDPHRCQHLRHCPPAGLIVRALTEEAVSIKCQYDFIPNIHLNETLCVWFTSLCSGWWLFSKGNYSF